MVMEKAMPARILVVDDDDAWRGIVANMLEKAGYIVQEAKDGAEGLIAHRIEAFQLVITDIFMPERDGIEVVIALREIENRPKILAMSGSESMGTLDFVTVASLLGADTALRKPFSANALCSTVRDLLGEA